MRGRIDIDTVQGIWSNAHSFTMWILLEFLLCVIAFLLIGIRQKYTEELTIPRELRGIEKNMHKMVLNVNGEKKNYNRFIVE